MGNDTSCTTLSHLPPRSYPQMLYWDLLLAWNVLDAEMLDITMV